ncbi:hypothetical protein P153DRAFT_346273 [Dothidotthia symphoricarpi CBS 119687]|uniref:Cylicin I n=1 Tax=Dothidotthia symphoricarpi CBS 119687 TaxID=1392245 RepID=A0A6A6A5X0_9PLEO|nr:uncharacterized protein P153DRAFT_346273 [Dothidotthia symphoricarpi CBS 119687]KAF2126484.1 hypothetical protein P153DRAFT_346273 [Dothidotthia symphoricarpi CBS 119687]
MSLIRSTTLRASSIARAARPARCIRTAELPWQRALQRRTYASGHGAHGQAPSSDVPWMAASAVGTATGLYIVVTQDTSHGAAHGEHHDDHHAEKDDEPEEEAADDAEEKDESSDDSKDSSKDKDDEPKHVADDGSKDESSNDITHSESREKKAEDKKAEKSGRGEGNPGDEKEASPDKSDKASPRKDAKSSNEMSGKQEGMSNADTHHSSEISKHDEKSKKGEGVAETAKLKGTVSTDRPGAENKEERGKNQQNKDE